ncbi:MAG: hypothetical protein ABFD66_00435 [Smithella sp.]
MPKLKSGEILHNVKLPLTPSEVELFKQFCAERSLIQGRWIAAIIKKAIMDSEQAKEEKKNEVSKMSML